MPVRTLEPRTILLLAGLLLTACLLASSAEAASRLLGAPSYDHATETTYRQVYWEDFRGSNASKPPEWNRWSRGSYAHIATKIELGKVEFEDRREGDVWLVSAPRVRPYALMNKDFSAVRHGARNAYTLAHEQLHFDIAETVARRLAVELAQLEGRGSTQKAAYDNLTGQLRQRFEAGFQEFIELQERYDAETEHGLKKKKQKKWAEEVPEMFRQATEALAAFLEQRGRSGTADR
ncbi:MAG: DUF922 domain-containing protein [Acidobacteriota bacterium]